MSRICLYFFREPEVDRWIWGDRYVRPIVRRMVRGKPGISGVDRVFVNLCLGLDQLQIPYKVNLPFDQLQPSDRVGVLGRSIAGLASYRQPNPIVAGPVLMTAPWEHPTFCQDYPISQYVQHSEWARQVYVPYYGEARCGLWAVGIETDVWQPDPTVEKSIDFLIYNKVRWQQEHYEQTLFQPIRAELTRRNLSFQEIQYGNYSAADYQQLLHQSKAMIFVCEHESQGIAYQEALSMNVPILAWDQGWCLDPYFYKEGKPYLPATSVPFWDDRCGMRFQDVHKFPTELEQFLSRLNDKQFSPREYVLENLTLKSSAKDYLKLLHRSNA